MIAIYSRQSLEKKESISIESQIEFSKREIFQEEFQIYTDVGYSGKNTNRPEFQKMMKKIKNGEIKKVIVYRLDRISRSLVDFADFMEILEKNKTAFVSATEKFDTSTPMGKAMLYIVVVFAQLERETIASRVQDNYFARVGKGAWGGGLPPYGFKLERIETEENNMTILVPTQDLKLVEKIFKLYGNKNMSLSKIQKEIKIPSFTSSKISKILKNPVYVKSDFSIFNYYNNQNIPVANDYEEFNGKYGCFLVGKGTLKEKLLSLAPHLGIINSKLFLKCQEKLCENLSIKNSGNGKHTWLTGLVKCGNCGYGFSVRSANTSCGKTHYFSCSGKYVYKCCKEKQTHKVYGVEEKVEKIILDIFLNYPMHKREKSKNLDYKTEISNLENKIEYLVNTLENNENIHEHIGKKISKLHKEIVELQNKQCSEKNSEVGKIVYFQKEKWDKMVLEEKAILVKKIIKKVELTNRNMKIYFKIPKKSEFLEEIISEEYEIKCYYKEGSEGVENAEELEQLLLEFV